MKNKQNKILRNFIIAYLILCTVSIMIVARVCADNSNCMSYLGSFLGGILGEFATLVAIYFTLVSMKQDVMLYPKMMSFIYKSFTYEDFKSGLNSAL